MQLCVGKERCSIPVSMDTLKDPCPNVLKTLAVEALCRGWDTSTAFWTSTVCQLIALEFQEPSLRVFTHDLNSKSSPPSCPVTQARMANKFH